MKPRKSGHAAFAAVHVVCCGGLLLFATGLLTVGGITAWLGSGPARATGMAVLAVAAIVALAWRLRRRKKQSSEIATGARGNNPTAGNPAGSH